ncbi:MAG: hypothetical protein IT371_01000 [Deltaproteobacteria bacterium]|nr:hypothetical protein [Deltaproteobacteria bacterium]
MTPSRIPTLLALVFASLAGFACTVDEETIENKACDIYQPKDRQCIAGYECKCQTTGTGSGCFCRRVTKLSVPPAEESHRILAPESPSSALLPRELLSPRDPSVCFLRRQGFEIGSQTGSEGQ